MNRELEPVQPSRLARTDDADANPPVRLSDPGGMFVFRYSCTEISTQGQAIQIRRNEARYANGKLTSEEYEGTLDRAAYDGMVREVQDYFLNRIARFMKLF